MSYLQVMNNDDCPNASFIRKNDCPINIGEDGQVDFKNMWTSPKVHQFGVNKWYGRSCVYCNIISSLHLSNVFPRK